MTCEAPFYYRPMLCNVRRISRGTNLGINTALFSVQHHDGDVSYRLIYQSLFDHMSHDSCCPCVHVLIPVLNFVCTSQCVSYYYNVTVATTNDRDRTQSHKSCPFSRAWPCLLGHTAHSAHHAYQCSITRQHTTFKFTIGAACKDCQCTIPWIWNQATERFELGSWYLQLPRRP